MKFHTIAHKIIERVDENPNNVYRIELSTDFREGVGVAKIFCYDRDENGLLQYDEENDDVKVLPPREVEFNPWEGQDQ